MHRQSEKKLLNISRPTSSTCSHSYGELRPISG